MTSQTLKKTLSFGLPWERQFGYVQALRSGDTIYLAGQVAHDESGAFVGQGDMEAQMRRAYANVVRVLNDYGATLSDLVEETLFVLDIDAAFKAGARCRSEIFGGSPQLPSTLVQIERLSFPELLIEIRCTARVPSV